MKVTWGWLGDWTELPPTPEALAQALAMRGFPVASIDHGTALDLDPTIVVGHVLDVSQHPNADRLRLCRVDIGSATLSIVWRVERGSRSVGRGGTDWIQASR